MRIGAKLKQVETGVAAASSTTMTNDMLLGEKRRAPKEHNELKHKTKKQLIQKLKLIGRDSNFIFKPINFSCHIRCGAILTYELPNNLPCHYEYTATIYGNHHPYDRHLR